MRLFINLFALFLCAPALAQSAHYDFKGIELGSSLSLIENNDKYSCRDPESPLADTMCSLGYKKEETIAGVPVEVMLLFYYDRTLNRISISFASDKFSQVISALRKKYGSGIEKTETVQNSLGTRFKNQIVTWKADESQIMATKYSGNISRSSVLYELEGATRIFEARKQSAAGNHSEDL